MKKIYSKNILFAVVISIFIGIQPVTSYSFALKDYFNSAEVAAFFSELIVNKTVGAAILSLIGSLIAAHTGFYLKKQYDDRQIKAQIHNFMVTGTGKIVKREDYVGMPVEAKNLIDEVNDVNRHGNLVKGILFQGNPGTGKTFLARVIANEVGCPFFQLNGSDFVQNGIPLGNFVQIFFNEVREVAKKHSSRLAIVFIDEIDALGSRDGSNDVTKAVINAFLGEMDGFKAHKDSRLIVIGATNYAYYLDKALVRAGRFDQIIRINNPDFDTRMKIIEKLYCDYPYEDNITKEQLAELFVGKTPAEINAIFREAKRYQGIYGNKKITKQCFIMALDIIRSNEKALEKISEGTGAKDTLGVIKKLIQTFGAKYNLHSRLDANQLAEELLSLSSDAIENIFYVAHNAVIQRGKNEQVAKDADQKVVVGYDANEDFLEKLFQNIAENDYKKYQKEYGDFIFDCCHFYNLRNGKVMPECYRGAIGDSKEKVNRNDVCKMKNNIIQHCEMAMKQNMCTALAFCILCTKKTSFANDLWCVD